MKAKNAVLTFLILALIVFIWGNSCLPPSQSDGISYGVLSVIAKLLPSSLSSEDANHIIRKIAHFSEFFILGALLCLRFSKDADCALISFALALSAAITDETIQIFTGRGPSLFDVLIDSSGAAFAITLVSLILLLKRKKSAV